MKLSRIHNFSPSNPPAAPPLLPAFHFSVILSLMPEKAITILDMALQNFQSETGLVPRVILLPPKIFQAYEQESRSLDAILPKLDASDEAWTDVRVVEHEGVTGIEVY